MVRALVLCGVLILSGCVTTAPIEEDPSPPAAGQVVYRLDHARYIEIEPLKAYRCDTAKAYWVDTKRGIRSYITRWDRFSAGPYVIDAADGQFLVSPLILPSNDCQSGGYDACKTYLYYSTDYGSTWLRTSPPYTSQGGPMIVVGAYVYHAGRRARVAELPLGDAAWEPHLEILPVTAPPPQLPPIDEEFHCDDAMPGTPSASIG